MRTARRRGQPQRRPKTRLRVDDYWQRWWIEEVTVGKARGTQYGYRDIYACYIGPQIGDVRLRDLVEDPQVLVRWRTHLAQTKSQAVVQQAHRVLSSMLSAAAEAGEIPHNPILLLAQRSRRGRARKLARTQAPREPVAIDPVAWFLVLDYLRRPTRPPIKGTETRARRYPLDRNCDALILALGFMAGLRLPSEALGLTRQDVRGGRLHIEGRSSSGEYAPGSKTGPGRDLPLCKELAEELGRVAHSHHDAGRPMEAADFWIAARDGGIWSEHQARNWREREFRPIVRQVAADFPQFPELRTSTPYLSRHTFVSCCLQAGISLATIAAWSGTSIQMISRTYGRMIRRHEGTPPLGLAEQYQTAKVQAMSLLSAQSPTPSPTQGGPTAGPTALKLPPARRRNRAD
jgi:integrase